RGGSAESGYSAGSGGSSLFSGGGGGGGGGRGGGGGGEGEISHRGGRPSIGTWQKTQTYLQILKELSGKDEEELEWLTDAKKGGALHKSETEQARAEGEYHRLLYEESVLQARKKAYTHVRDREVESGLRKMVKLGKRLKELDASVSEGGDVEEAPQVRSLAGRKLREEQVQKASAADGEPADGTVPEELTRKASTNEGCQDEDTVDKFEPRKEKEKAVTEEKERTISAQLEEIAQAKVPLRDLLKKLHAEFAYAAGDSGVESDAGRGPGKKKQRDWRQDKMQSSLQVIIGESWALGVVCSSMESQALEKATAGIASLAAATAELQEEIRETRTKSQAALAEMEKWIKRKEALPEYDQVTELGARERAWFERERGANEEALRKMRRLVPVDVTRLTLLELEAQARDRGSLYTRELSMHIKASSMGFKENRFLHWVVEHPDDIARANFLRGDHAHFFTNLDKYDLSELRALAACLPERFEVDRDGRKAAWRTAFLHKVQGMVSQERGDTVSGGWDPAAKQRRTVRLPGLRQEQVRKAVYFYPTEMEVQARLEGLLGRHSKLDMKKDRLTEAKDVLLPEARQEYANVLEDTRNPVHKEQFSAEQLRSAREEAKDAVDRHGHELLGTDVRRLEAEVAESARALSAGPYTVESLKAEKEAVCQLLHNRARATKAAAAAAARARVEESDALLPGVEGDVAARSEDGGSGDVPRSGEAGAGVREEEEEEEEEVDVGAEKLLPLEQVEVVGPFDPEPKLESRFADRERSFKFVTAEEDARMRREELERAIGMGSATGSGGRDGEAVAAMAGALTGALPASLDVSTWDSSPGKLISHLITSSPAAGQAGRAAADDSRPDTERMEDEANRGPAKIKALGLIVEKTLIKSLERGRPPLPGSTAALAVVMEAEGRDHPGSSVTPSSSSPPRANGDGFAKLKSPVPHCKPKSKFFQSMRSTARNKEQSLLPESPALPRAGLLAQIRAGLRGEGKASEPAGSPEPPLGLLAQIRGRGKKGDPWGGGDSGGQGGGAEGGHGAAQGLGLPPPPLPLPPK
ncbi:unnamed protein product, partial [Discosporangium mesarthrocarpum]